MMFVFIIFRQMYRDVMPGDSSDVEAKGNAQFIRS